MSGDATVRRGAARRAVVALALLAISAAAAAAQAGSGVERPDAERRARWEALPEERREELRRRYEEFHRLPLAEQQRVRQRARRLVEMRERLREHLPAEAREWLGSLPPRERAQFDRRVLAGPLREMSALLRDQLPPEARARLDGMPPREREGAMRRHFDRILEERTHRLLEAPPPWLPEEEAARLRDLPPPERRRAVSRIQRNHLVGEVESNPALLGRIDPEAWERLKALPPERFLPRFFLWRRSVEGGSGPFGRDRGPGPAGPRRGGPRRDGVR